LPAAVVTIHAAKFVPHLGEVGISGLDFASDPLPASRHQAIKDWEQLVANGTHMVAKRARSHTARPGATKSKSSSPTAAPSRNTTFSRHTSLWQRTGPLSGSAISSLQVQSDRSSPRDAWCKRRMSALTDARASSLCAQAGNGGTATSPAMNRSRSRPSSPIVGAIPVSERCRELGCGVQGDHVVLLADARRPAWRVVLCSTLGRVREVDWSQGPITSENATG
jgi:hypothetical protein